MKKLAMAVSILLFGIFVLGALLNAVAPEPAAAVATTPVPTPVEPALAPAPVDGDVAGFIEAAHKVMPITTTMPDELLINAGYKWCHGFDNGLSEAQMHEFQMEDLQDAGIPPDVSAELSGTISGGVYWLCPEHSSKI